MSEPGAAQRMAGYTKTNRGRGRCKKRGVRCKERKERERGLMQEKKRNRSEEREKKGHLN